MRGKMEQTKGNGLYITSSKSRERKGKKTKVNNPCITSLKSYERRENIPSPFHPQDKRKEKLHIPSPKYMVGQCSKYGLSTHSLTYSLTLHLPSLQNTQEEEKTPSLHLNCWTVHTFIKGSMVSLVKNLWTIYNNTTS